MAVEQVPSVTSVASDMNDHTVTVEFDDDQTSIDDIVKALGKAGYTVPSYSPES